MTQDSQNPMDPMDPLIDQVNEILKFAERNLSKPIEGTVSPEIKKQLDKLKADVDKFSDDCDRLLGVQSENIIKTYTKMGDHPEELTSREKKLIRLYGDLGTNALVLRIGLNRAKKEVEGTRRYDMGTNTKKSIQRRKNKFKGLEGSGESWKKL